jgi:anti-anti-sigma factor
MAVLRVDGALHGRQGAELRKEVHTLLRRGERAIVVCLARASNVDAAGIGELVRAYHMTAASAAILRVTEATGRVREVLARVGLFDILCRV